MQTLISRFATATFALIFVSAVAAGVAAAGDVHKAINTGDDGVAILGYDPVAYFTESRPIKGKPEFVYEWEDAIWHFANAKHRDLFAGSPEKYAPQYGGHCSMALSQGGIKVVNPEAWMIVDGKLYLSFSKKGREKFNQDISGNIKKANENWAKVRKKN